MISALGFIFLVLWKHKKALSLASLHTWKVLISPFRSSCISTLYNLQDLKRTKGKNTGITANTKTFSYWNPSDNLSVFLKRKKLRVQSNISDSINPIFQQSSQPLQTELSELIFSVTNINGSFNFCSKWASKIQRHDPCFSVKALERHEI